MRLTKGALLVLPALSGLILGLVLYKILPEFCVFVALVPFLLFVDRVRSVVLGAVGGFLGGFVYFLFVLHTLVYVEWFGFLSDEALFMKVAYVIACGVGGATYALFAGVAVRVWRRHWHMLAIVPAVFVFVEVLRRLVAFGFTWGFIGYLTEDMPSVLQSASVGGVLGLSFLIVCVNVGVILALFSLYKGEYVRAGTILGAAVAVVVVCGVGAYAVRTYVLAEVGTVRVAVMEVGNQRGSMRLDGSLYRQLFTTAREQGAELIVMPESLIDPRHHTLAPDEVGQIITDLAGDYAGTVAVGGFRSNGSETYNSFFFWHDGALVGTYDKQFLVPFAEYSPRFFSRFAPKGATLYTHGAAYQSFIEVAGVRIGTLVCQEVNYPEAGAREARAGAELLISGANDGFVTTPAFLQRFAPGESDWFHELEYRYARYRAVESGRYLARSTKVGISGIIDTRGEDVVVQASGSRGVLVQDIPRIEGKTPYARFGDAPLIILSILLVYGTYATRRRGDNEDVV